VTALSDVVETFLREDGWPVTELGDGAWISTVEGSTGRWQVSFEVRKGEVLVVRSHSPMHAPAEHRAAVLEYAARATFGLALGAVEVDADNGQAAVRTGFDGENVPADALPTLVKAAAYANVHLANRYLPGLLAVALGALDPVMGLPPDERPDAGEDGT
jgi:hypothetical protein